MNTRIRVQALARVDYCAKCAGDGLRLVSSADRGTDGETRCAGGEDLRGIFERDPAEREGGQRSFAHRLAHILEAGEFFELLSLRWKDRTNADVTRAVADRLLKLVERMSADTDE